MSNDLAGERPADRLQREDDAAHQKRRDGDWNTNFWAQPGLVLAGVAFSGAVFELLRLHMSDWLPANPGTAAADPSKTPPAAHFGG